jgi:hypothetical protein
MVQHERVDRQAALERVLEQRCVGQARPRAIRVGSAAFGIVAALVAVPLVIVLPELGIPLLLLALRLLAVEFDWAAHSYAWVLWRWQQAVAWYHAASTPVRTLVVLALLAVAVALLWLLAHEFL